MICYATIAEGSPRRPLWLELFGTDTVPIESPETVIGTVPGLDGPRRFYSLYFDELPRETKDRIVAWVVERTGLEPGLAFEVAWGKHSVPILADHEVTIRYRGEFFI